MVQKEKRFTFYERKENANVIQLTTNSFDRDRPFSFRVRRNFSHYRKIIAFAPSERSDWRRNAINWRAFNLYSPSLAHSIQNEDVFFDFDFRFFIFLVACQFELFECEKSLVQNKIAFRLHEDSRYFQCIFTVRWTIDRPFYRLDISSVHQNETIWFVRMHKCPRWTMAWEKRETIRTRQTENNNVLFYDKKEWNRNEFVWSDKSKNAKRQRCRRNRKYSGHFERSLFIRIAFQSLTRTGNEKRKRKTTNGKKNIVQNYCY